MNTKQKMGMMAVSAIGVIGLATAGVNYASADDAARWPERNAAIQTALEAKDYTAWKSAIGNAAWAEKVTEENFNVMTQIHELRVAGKFDEAQALAKANGLEPGQHKGMFKNKGNRPEPAQHEAMIKAIESGDYEGWKKLAGDRPATDIITPDNFAQFQKMHELLKSGDMAGAKVIAKELGLPEVKGKGPEARQEHGKNQGRGMGRGMGLGRMMNR